MTVHSFPVSSPVAGAGAPPVLIISSGGAALRRAEEAIAGAGWRTVAVPLEGVSDRLERQVDASAVWIEFDIDEADPEALIRAAIGGHHFPTLVSLPFAMLDRVEAAVGGRSTELLVEPSALDRVTALSLVAARRGVAAAVHEVSTEPSAARLRQLSDEVGRIAATLARLSISPTPASVELPPLTGKDGDASVSGDTVRAVIRARRLRARFFDADLFADPAWDMLLDLFQAEIAQHRVPVSSLCIAAAVPPTTALRWIKTMTEAGLFRRRADPHDGRRIFIELDPSASSAMRRYFSQVGVANAA